MLKMRLSVRSFSKEKKTSQEISYTEKKVYRIEDISKGLPSQDIFQKENIFNWSKKNRALIKHF